MKLLLLSVFFTSLIFLIIDVIWLSYSVKYLYRPQLGPLLTDKPIMWAAILFYLVYILGLSLIVIKPAIASDSIYQAFFHGLVLGLVAYGTYNLTNMATIKNWSPIVVMVDMLWGGFLTSLSSGTGIYLAKKIFFN
jgi:uncharacterized membrane protein